MATKTIARTLGASRNSVRLWLRAGAFVPYRRAPAPNRLDAHLRFVEVRWQAGQHNAAGLYRELRASCFGLRRLACRVSPTYEDGICECRFQSGEPPDLAWSVFRCGASELTRQR